MEYIFFLFSLLFLPILSLKEIKPKLCTNCKYFITDNKTGKYGRCSLFPKEETNIYTLVNGIREDNDDNYNFCATSRSIENMCGKEGKKYKKKYTKKRI